MKKTKLEDILIINESTVSGVDEMVYNPVTGNPADNLDKGVDNGTTKENIKWGGHDTHIHIGATNRDVMMSIIDKAQGMGLRCAENPYAKNSTVNPTVHAKNSHHYKMFTGKTPLVGGGVDITGDGKQLRLLIRWVNTNYGDKVSSKDVVTTDTEVSTKGTGKIATTATSGSTNKTSGTTENNVNVYGGVLGGLFGNDGGDSLKKIGNDIWDKTMGEFQLEITKSDSSESKKLNEEIKRIKKMINL